jgi:hypothetical protein
MKPKIDRTTFGTITIDGELYERDVIIRLGGKVKKRKKKLSKAVYGTSHTISLDEAKYVHEKGVERLIMVQLSDKAADYFAKKHCEVELLPTKKAIGAWNEATGNVIGLFHVTC